MRSYPANSPQAAARIGALTVVADGDIGGAEIAWLDRLAVHEKLGLARHELHALLDTFCEDLLSSGQLQWADACLVDERTLADLMGEIQDPALRPTLLHVCVELAEADAHVDEGESTVLVAAVEHWGLHREMFELILRRDAEDADLGLAQLTSNFWQPSGACSDVFVGHPRAQRL